MSWECEGGGPPRPEATDATAAACAAAEEPARDMRCSCCLDRERDWARETAGLDMSSLCCMPPGMPGIEPGMPGKPPGAPPGN